MTKATASKDRLPRETLKALLCARPFDRTAWLENCGEHLHIRIANEAPLLTRALALDRLERLMQATVGFGSNFCDLRALRETIYIETDILLVAASRVQAIPCVIIARSTHCLLQDLRFYFDPYPLQASWTGADQAMPQ